MNDASHTGRAGRTCRDDHAAAPVIGTILMVATAIAFAGVVFYLVQGFGGPGETSISVAFAIDEQQDRLVVTSASVDADWSRVGLRVVNQDDASSIHMGVSSPYHNQESAAIGADVLAAQHTVATTSIQIVSQDYLDFCADAPATDVQLQIVDVAANARLGIWLLASVAACP